MEKINLEEILKKSIFKDLENISVGYDDKGKRDILEAMKEACLKTLLLAAENAECTSVNTQGFYTVDKQSILDVINLIE